LHTESSLAYTPRRVQDNITEPLYRDVYIYAAPQDVGLTTMLLPDDGNARIAGITISIMHDPVYGLPGISLLRPSEKVSIEIG
jgi:hypothetical protein